jgi:hypothetical protein
LWSQFKKAYAEKKKKTQQAGDALTKIIPKPGNIQCLRCGRLTPPHTAATCVQVTYNNQVKQPKLTLPLYFEGRAI